MKKQVDKLATEAATAAKLQAEAEMQQFGYYYYDT